MTSPRWWAPPADGDIVWCRFPAAGTTPGPKPRPGLILVVDAQAAPRYNVQVAYGTSQKTHQLHPGEFLISQARHPAAYAAAGLSYDTKFDLAKTVWLPYHGGYFTVPPAAPYGQMPKLGVLAASLHRAAAAAYRAAQPP